jgi:hypothetical protein
MAAIAASQIAVRTTIRVIIGPLSAHGRSLKASSSNVGYQAYDLHNSSAPATAVQNCSKHLTLHSGSHLF